MGLLGGAEGGDFQVELGVMDKAQTTMYRFVCLREGSTSIKSAQNIQKYGPEWVWSLPKSQVRSSGRYHHQHENTENTSQIPPLFFQRISRFLRPVGSGGNHSLG